jgi:glycosyltransferase involved in cell wall biosynthesis
LAKLHIALLPWGHTIEDFLHGIGVSFEQFCAEMTGGWLFSYVQALQLAGFQVTIFCFSDRSRAVVSGSHQATGAEICLIPAKPSYLWMRRFVADPYAWETDQMFSGRKLPKLAKRIIRHLLPYLATPERSLWRELRRRKVRAVLCQEYEYARFDIVTALGALLRLPVFAIFQGGNWHSSRLEKISRPLAVRRCAGLIIGPSSEAARVQMEYSISSNKIARLPNPLDLTDWEPMARSEARKNLGIPSSARVAISHGRIDIFRKGLDLLLDAWSRIRLAHPAEDWRLVLIGSGDDVTRFRELLSGPDYSSVLWIDHYIRDRALMLRWLSAADVYVMASRHEGFPVAPLEAMACGLPVVSTAVPGIAEIMGEETPFPGITVPIGDAASLANAMEKLLADIQLARDLGFHAKRRAQDFSLLSVSTRLGSFLAERIDKN